MDSTEFERLQRANKSSSGLLFGKYKFKVIPNEPNVSYWIEKDGYWESYVSATIYNLFQKARFKVCVDVGANIGYYSFLYHFLGAKKIYAFEPVPENYTVLLSNVFENGLEQEIFCLQRAVTDSCGETVICTDRGLPNAFVSDSGIRVLTVSLDEFFFSANFKDMPEFIKIDAEGSEDKIISGAKNLLKDYVSALHVEMSTERGYDMENLFNTISEYFPNSYDMLSGLPGKIALQSKNFVDMLFWKDGVW